MIEGWCLLGLVVVVALFDAWRRDCIKKKYEALLLHERKMRIVAECAVEALLFDHSDRASSNARRVSEVQALLHKSTSGGQPN